MKSERQEDLMALCCAEVTCALACCVATVTANTARHGQNARRTLFLTLPMGPPFFLRWAARTRKKRLTARLRDDGIPRVDIVIRKNLGANCA